MVSDIDWDSLGEYAKAGSTITELASSQGISTDTLKRKCESAHGMKLSDWMANQKATGHAELRLAQRSVAIKKQNPIMLIFLGKNELGQSDRPTNTSDSAKTFLDAIGDADKITVRDVSLYEDSELDDV